MLFGQTQRRGLFGTPGRQPWETPGFGGPLGRQPWETPGFGGPLGDEVAVPSGGGMGEEVAPPEPKQKTNWGGVFADFLAGLGGREGPYLAALKAEQERAAEAREYQRRRRDEQTTWMEREQWKRDNAAPPSDSFARTLAGAGIAPGTPEYAKMMRQRAEALANPMQMVMGPDGRPYFMPRTGPAETPEFTDDDWNAAAGGGGGNATGGFQY